MSVRSHPTAVAAASLAVALLLAGCGGGGGDGNGAETPDPEVPGNTFRWSVAERVESINTGGATRPKIAMDFAGNAVALWTQEFNSSPTVRINRYTLGSGWGDPFLVDFEGGGTPALAVDGAGGVQVVWHWSEGARPLGIEASTFTPGASFFTLGEEIDVSDIGNATRPDVAMDALGNAVAVWRQDYGLGPEVLVCRYTAGLGWGQPFFVTSENPGTADDPRIVVNGRGDAVVTWTEMTAGSSPTRSLWASRSPAGDQFFGAPFRVDRNNTGGVAAYDVAIDPAGRALAVWTQNFITMNRVWASRSAALDNWDAPQIIEDHLAGGSRRPQVALDDSGNGIAVWGHVEDNLGSLWTNRFTAGAGWGQHERLHAGTVPQSMLSLAQIAMNPEGKALVVSMLHDGSSYRIWANDYTPEFGWGSGELIETGVDGRCSYPQISIDPQGRGLAIWEQSGSSAAPDPGGTSIWASRFE